MAAHSTAMEMMHVKLYVMGGKHGAVTQEMRRFGVAPGTGLEEMRQMVQGMVKSGGDERQQPLLTYRDSDGDLVTIGSELEWEECQRVGNSYRDPCNPLRLHARRKGQNNKAAGKGTGATAASSTEGEGEERGSQGRYFYQADGPPQEHSADRLEELKKAVEGIVDRYRGVVPKFLQQALQPMADDEVDVDLQGMAQALSDQGLQDMTSGKLTEALQHLSDSYVIRPTYVTRYNMGCCYALAGETDRAVEALQGAVEMGYSNAEHMASDEDLVSLHTNAQFVELLHRMADGPKAEEAAGSGGDAPVEVEVEVGVDDEVEVEVEVEAPTVPVVVEEETPAPAAVPQPEGPVVGLMEMGFSMEQASAALAESQGDRLRAIEILLAGM